MSLIPPTEHAPRPEKGFLRRYLGLAGSYWRSGNKWKTRGLLAALLVLTVAQVFLLIRVNLWSAGLFDSLEQRSMDRFLAHIGLLLGILAGLMGVNGTHLWVKRRLQLDWRRWMTKKVLGDWMAEGRHHQVMHMPGTHDNPDGRIAEDIRVTTEAAIDLAHSLFYCILLLIGFTQILWSLSGVVTVDFAAAEIPVPGHMVWVAVLYAGIGSAMAFWFGLPLVRAVDRRQTAEANFRFNLVRARENSETIALLHGESDERRRLIDIFRGVRTAWHGQTVALTRIFVFSSGYSLLSTAFPFLVSAPRYIAGAITLGALMQTAQAFQQMVQALSWPIDNIPRVAEWRASVERVLALHAVLQRAEAAAADTDGERIHLVPSDQPVLRLNDIAVADPGGEVVSTGISLHIKAGERVLISGDPGLAVKLFKVVAGLWPWGNGQVDLPIQPIFFMPQRPYLPIEPLRDALCYPAAPGSFDDAALSDALNRVGLGDLVRRLDRAATWEKMLTIGEQQRLGFARLLLNRPSWIFIQEATDALDTQGEQDMMRLLQSEFAAATVITIGYHAALKSFHRRWLSIDRAADGSAKITEPDAEVAEV